MHINSTIKIVLLFTIIGLTPNSNNALKAQRLDLTSISNFDEFRYTQFKIAPDGTWYILLESGELLTSSDESLTWLPFPLPTGLQLENIRFFSDGSPIILTDNGYYRWESNSWIKINNLDGLNVLQIYEDIIYIAIDGQIYQSTDRGDSNELIITSNEYEQVLKIRVSQQHIYVLGRTEKFSFYSAYDSYEKYDRNFQFVEIVDGNGVKFEKIDVTDEDEIGISTSLDLTGSDSNFTEFAYGIETHVRIYDLKAKGQKVYFTFNGYKLGIYDRTSDSLIEYEVNQQGKIHFDNNKIYIADKNRILDITNIESGIIDTITPQLKRRYTDAIEYRISRTGKLYAYTGYNIFSYDKNLNIWVEVDLNQDAILDFTFGPEGNLYILGYLNFFKSLDDGVTIETTAHRQYIFSRPQFWDKVALQFIQVYSKNSVLLYGYGPPLQGFGYVYGNLETNKFSPTFLFKHYPVTYLGEEVLYRNVNLIGPLDQNQEVEPLWPSNHPDLLGLGLYYRLLAIDSSLIYLHPSLRDGPGYNFATRDLGETWIKTTVGPPGDIFRGAAFETTWILSSSRLYTRDNVIDSYSEVDISSLDDNLIRILPEKNGNTYFVAGKDIYLLGEKIYHPQTISGSLFWDQNNDCTLQSNESLSASAWTFQLTGSNYDLTTISNNGSYDFDVPIGDYTLTAFPPSDLWSLCQSSYNIEVSTAGQEIVQDIGAITNEQCVDFELSLSTPKIKRCRTTIYTLSIKNIGNLPTDEAIVELTPDPFFELATQLELPNETLPNGNIRINFGNLAITETKSTSLIFRVSCESDLGQQHCMTAEVFSDNICNSASSEIITEYQNNVGPFDPNDMRVFNAQGYQSLNFEKDATQYYHVRFQNTGTDTAENVEVRIELDDSLDIRTLRLLDSSHKYDYSLNDRNDLLIRYNNIMLPDSNVNEPGSNGYFRYSILPINEVIEGQQFASSAAIYFDFNHPILTNDGLSQIGKHCGPPKVALVNIDVCQGEIFENYWRSGYYEDYFTSQDGCDSLRKLTLAINSRDLINLEEVILCPGEFYRGIETDTLLRESLQNIFGCDSIVRQQINSVGWSSDRHHQLTGCIGDTLSGYYESGIHKDTVRTRSSCYINIYEINITDVNYTSESHQLCYGESLGTITESGIYYDTLRTIELCDSLIIEKEVSILEKKISTIEIETCEGEFVEGYGVTGVFTDIFSAENGCDSTRILRLDIHPTYTNFEDVAICAGEDYLGYNESGIYRDTFYTVQGCDSIRILEIEVNDTPSLFFSAEICYGEKIEGYDTTGEYRDVFTSSLGCDSTRILNLTVLPSNHFVDTVFLCPWEKYENLLAPNNIIVRHTSVDGCDSIRQTDILLIENDDPACPQQYDAEPKLIRSTNFINLNPNPIRNNCTLEIQRSQLLPAELKIVNTRHQLVGSYQITDSKTSINFSELGSGVYIAVLESGFNVYIQRIIKL